MTVEHFDYDVDPERFWSNVKTVERYGLRGDVHTEVAERIAKEALWPALDMGCGEGRFREAVGDSGPVIATDLSMTMLGKAPAPRLCSDMTSLPLFANLFGSAAALWCLYHVPQPLDAIREPYRVLKPGGLFVTCAPSIQNEDGAYRENGKPFALFVSMNPPHPPYHLVPERYRAIYEGQTAEDLLVRPNVKDGFERAEKGVADYFAMVSGVDEQFGRILDALEDEGLSDNTIVVFTSDHGEMMGSHGRMLKNVWYEESFNVPFLVRWPVQLEARTDDLMIVQVVRFT